MAGYVRQVDGTALTCKEFSALSADLDTAPLPRWTLGMWDS
jgi:hypothetical protein